MSIPATDIVKGDLRLHLARYGEQGDTMMIGTLQLLQTMVKITDSTDVNRAINGSSYPVLRERQYLVACVNNWLETKVWGVYTQEQIPKMEAQRMFANTVEWKVLEIPEALERELRRGIFDLNQKPSGWCALL